ncbi:MAG: hypoxanthine phosphoribosyltransferase [Clostridia bacterium]|nr:hypoxanthine phosphoribosyltransferase [Clostridia bacterium]
MELYKDVAKILYSKEALEARTAELGAEISRDYKGKQLLMVCILRGAAIFFSDLIRKVDLDLEIDFMATSSYGADTKSSGEVKLQKDLNSPILGRDVLIVDDIIDSGLTLAYLKKLLLARNPASVKICALMEKPERKQANIEVDYVGFVVPNEFVVGYGLDYGEKYRQLPDVCVLSPEKY